MGEKLTQNINKKTLQKSIENWIKSCLKWMKSTGKLTKNREKLFKFG